MGIVKDILATLLLFVVAKFVLGIVGFIVPYDVLILIGCWLIVRHS